MKKILSLLSAPVVVLLVILISGYNLTPTNKISEPETSIVETGRKYPGNSLREKNWVRVEETPISKNKGITQEIISYALGLLGSPYSYSGISPAGFDCSGFVTHVFDKYNIAVPHSSKLQANEGLPVAKEEAAPGDLIIFTGTNEEVREPGHVGIVISEPGDTISFVHSSSNGGVKISKVQGTRYDVRFLEVRRVL